MQALQQSIDGTGRTQASSMTHNSAFSERALPRSRQTLSLLTCKHSRARLHMHAGHGGTASYAPLLLEILVRDVEFTARLERSSDGHNPYISSTQRPDAGCR